MNNNETSISLFEIDAELDMLLDRIQEQTASGASINDELLISFHAFCQAHGEKVDRIGRFIRIMEAREAFCRSESARLSDRARAAAGKTERTKSMAMFYLLSRNLTKVEGREFTLRVQKNSQDSIQLLSEEEVPVAFRRFHLSLSGVLYETVLAILPEELGQLFTRAVQESKPDAEAIKAAIARNECVPGVQLRRGNHLRVA